MSSATKLGIVPLLAIALAGLGTGLTLQMVRSDSGHPPFHPPVSLPATLLVIAGLLLFFALRLKTAIDSESKKKQAVNPFHAVRVLAAARASQITGALFSGFGAGLLLALADRPVGVMVSVWVPMALTLVTGVILLGVGIYAENACKVPPSDDAEGLEGERGTLNV